MAFLVVPVSHFPKIGGATQSTKFIKMSQALTPM